MLQLIDHHAHAVTLHELDLAALAGYLAETPNVPADHAHLDGPLGLAVRRWCPPLLDLPAFCGWPEYVDRRRELGAVDSSRRLLRGAGVRTMLLDSGYRGDELCDLPTMAELSGAKVREILRVETVAETVAATSSAAEFWPSVERSLHDTKAVGLKTVVAYRCGFRALAERPDKAPLDAAVDRWLSMGAARCDDPLIESHLVHMAARVGAERGMPLQLHVGLGDPDLTLHDVNPSLLTPLIREHTGTTFALLHCWPYEREAGYLATVFENVVFDVGLTLNHLGPSAPLAMARALELAPFHRQLYSSDAFGVAELHLAGAAQFRWALGEVLAGWQRDGSCTAADAEVVLTTIGAGAAQRAYRLGAPDTKPS
jgi:uncharacterized protein